MSLMVIPHQQFEQVLRETPGLGIAIARELAQRLRATDDRLH
jgi:CRP-like cAMP-binding protein